MTFDLQTVRADFPILEEKIHGHRLVYLDSGASAQKPNAVLERMDHAHRHEYANVHRGLHALANRATEAYEGGRERVRRFLNAERPDEIVFTKSATEAINLVAASFAGPRVREGDEIVLSIMEHHSNIVPWHFHRERQGAVLKWVDVGDDGSFDLDAFAAALGPRTRMVAVTHMSNVLGTMPPVKQIVELAHARGIPVLVDCSQGA
ncbi:MAG: aminotransferase class V-fold PLP-dependent enzyme, partial [Devosia sp.]